MLCLGKNWISFGFALFGMILGLVKMLNDLCLKMFEEFGKDELWLDLLDV